MKIVIVSNNMHIGGVQRALINLLNEISEEYDITLALFNPMGILMENIPENVKILPIKSDYRFLGLSKNDVKKSILLRLKRNVYAAITRLFGRDAVIPFMALRQETIIGYDVAISYLHNGPDNAFYSGCVDFVLRHINAKKKIAFLHCDYGVSGTNTIRNKKKYKQFDLIAACSQGCRTQFLKEIPELEDKTRVVYNCQHYAWIAEKTSKLKIEFDEEKINIITVSRFGKEKAIHRAIEALGQCKGDVDKMHYYIIGDGIQRTLIEDKVQLYDLEEHVTLLGELDNPYPYIKAADLLLIPSYSEAAPMVIGEAAYLETPVLSTRTSSAEELISDTDLGWVCENSISGLQEQLSLLINNKGLIEEKKNLIKQQQFDNQIAVTQFKEVLVI